MRKTNWLQRVCSLVIIVSLFMQQSGFAQVAGQVNIAGYLSGVRSNFAQDKFRPVHLRYLQYLPAENGFKLLVDKGDYFSSRVRELSSSRVKSTNPRTHEPENSTAHEPTNSLTHELNALMEYFAVGLRLSNESFWVNLRPDSPDNVIDDYLAQTDVGRVMLESDLQLKKDVSMMTSPETAQGKIYWDKLYKKAEELFGYENVTIPTLTRPWIVPGEVIISETADSAYIYKATLKVMLEEDYLSSRVSESVTSRVKTTNSLAHELANSRTRELNTYSTQLIKELIIPKLTQEINSSKRYAKLRQVYYSLIMAQWFKQRFGSQKTDKTVGTGRDLSDNYYKDIINSGNLVGLTSKSPWSKETYFQEYQKSFKDGEYNVKQTVSTPTGQVIRSYFSGGEMLGLPNIVTGEIPVNNAASPVIFSLPAAASSAVNYNPEEMAAIKVNGELDIVHMGDQDSGLLGVTAVSSPVTPMTQQDKSSVIVKYIAIILIGTGVGSFLYKVLGIEPANRKAQERINVLAESAYYGSDTAIDELGLKIAQDEIGAQAAADSLESLAIAGKDMAFKALADLAGDGNKIALNAIISLAHRNYPLAQEWLKNIDPSSISSTNPNPLASKILALMEQGLILNVVEAGELKQAREKGAIYKGDKIINWLGYWENFAGNGGAYWKDKLEELSREFKESKISKEEYIGGRLVIILNIRKMIDYEMNFIEQNIGKKRLKIIILKTTPKKEDIYRRVGFKTIGDNLILTNNSNGTLLTLSVKRISDLDGRILETIHVYENEQETVIEQAQQRYNTAVDEIKPWSSWWKELNRTPNKFYRRVIARKMEDNLKKIKDSYVKGIRDFYNKLYEKTLENGYLVNVKTEQPQSFNNGRSDNKTVSVVNSSPVGGIDFITAFPIITRAVSNLSIGASGVSMDRFLRVDLRRDWSEIERMASSGIRVSPERLKEYVQASCAQDAVGMDRDKVLLCISDRLKQEEESGLSSEPLVIDMLAVLQSTSSQAQLRAVFIGN